MIEQMSETVLTLLLSAVVIGTLVPVIHASGPGRRERSTRIRVIGGGILCGLALSGLLTVVNTIAPRLVNRQTIALWTLPVAIVLAFALLILVALAKNRRNAAGLDRAILILAFAYIVFAVFRTAPTAMTQAVMLFPSGVEIFSTSMALALSGYALGWVSVIALGWVAARLGAFVPRLWPSVVLILTLAGTHALMIVRILQAQRVIRVSKRAFAFISWFINHEAIFPLVAVAVLVVVAALTWYSTRTLPSQGDNPAQSRLYRARVRTWKTMAGVGAIGYLCGALLITVGVALGNVEVELSEPENYAVVNEEATINLDAISDGHLHRFAYTTASGVEVRFIVIQKAGSSFGVGLDACEICGASGYYEKDGKIICKLCEVAMNIATIGFKGGCNPIPIDYEVSDGALHVPLSVLEANAEVFA